MSETNVYLDASALVKRYVAETGSREVEQLVAHAGSLATGLLSRVEVPVALAKAARVGWLDRGKAVTSLQSFQVQWPDYMCVQTTEALMALADRLAWDLGLRGYDAVHLASAVMWQQALGESVTLATYDRQLWDAAPTAGLTAWPAILASHLATQPSTGGEP